MVFGLPGALSTAYAQDVDFRYYETNILPERTSERPVERGCQLDESSVTTTFYVDGNHPDADDSNPGTEVLPLKTIRRAVKMTDHSQPTRIIIRPGIYREQVRLEDDREWSTHQILILEAETQGTVILSGSDIYTDWVEESNHYVHGWEHKWGFAGTEYDHLPFKDLGRRTELVAIGHTRLKQYLSLDELTEGSFCVDETSEKIYMIPPGGTLSEDVDVEVGMRKRQLEIIGRANVVIRGIHFIHSRGALDYATCRFVYCSNVLVEDCSMYNNSTMGLLANHTANITIRRVNSLHNGGNGFDSYNLQNSIIEDCNFSYNCWRSHHAQIYHYFPAGTKNVRMKNCLIRNNEFIGNLATGCWLDVNCEFIDVEGNVAMENNRYGIYTETNCGPVTLRNNRASCNNYSGLQVAESWNVTLTGNTLFQNRGTQLGIRGTIRSQYGEDPKEWTYAADTRSSEIRYRYEPANLVVTGNILFSESETSHLISHGVGGRFNLYQHVNTYVGDTNTFFHTSSSEALHAVPIYSDSLSFEDWKDVTLEEWTELTGQDGNSEWLDPNLFYLTTYTNEGEVGIHVYNAPGIDSVELFISDLENNDQGLFFIDWNDIKHMDTDYDAPYVFNIRHLTDGRYMFFARAYTSDGGEMTSDRIEYNILTGMHPPNHAEETNESGVHVYPNPSNGRFSIGYSSEYHGSLEVMIYNSSGQQIHHERFVKHERMAVMHITMDSEVEAGVYLVQLVAGGNTIYKLVAIYN
jgi:parallel beta-helix repeat protein